MCRRYLWQKRLLCLATLSLQSGCQLLMQYFGESGYHAMWSHVLQYNGTMCVMTHLDTETAKLACDQFSRLAIIWRHGREAETAACEARCTQDRATASREGATAEADKTGWPWLCTKCLC